MRTSLNGSCTDEIISSLLGDIVTTNIVNLDNKVLNQKRAIWLTPEKARNIYVTNSLAKANERVLIAEKNLAKIRSTIGKRKRDINTQEVNDGTVSGRKENLTERVSCTNDCGLHREVVENANTLPYDNWIGCTVCPKWFCSKKLCLAKFKKHHIRCLTEKQTRKS